MTTRVHPSGFTADGTRVGRHRAEGPAVVADPVTAEFTDITARHRTSAYDADDFFAEVARRSYARRAANAEYARIKAGA